MKKSDAIAELEELIKRASEKYDIALSKGNDTYISYYSGKVSALEAALEIVRYMK